MEVAAAGNGVGGGKLGVKVSGRRPVGFNGGVERGYGWNFECPELRQPVRHGNMAPNQRGREKRE